MRILSIDYASKTGWVYGEIVNDEFKPITYGKFKTVGNNEAERVQSLIRKTLSLMAIFKEAQVDVVLFEDSIAGGLTSLKTLRSTFGKRYTLIGILQSMLVGTKIKSIKPTGWFKHLPLEVQNSKIEFNKSGKPKKVKGKEKKEAIVNYINHLYPHIGLKWLNERADCDNDVADSFAMAHLYAKGLLVDIEEIN